MTQAAAKTSPEDHTGSTRKRLQEKKQKNAEIEEHHPGFLMRARGYLDALVFAYVLAMFIRTFVFELFMIPTGSMTPTLIGDHAGDVAILDYDEDGIDDVAYTFAYGRTLQRNMQIYLMNEDGTYKDQVFLQDVPSNVVASLRNSSERRKDMILVNKFSYWFSDPDRGDIAVFKVPHRPEHGSPFDSNKPVYIKRVLGLPGETLVFPPGRIWEASRDDRYGTKLGGREFHVEPSVPLVDGEKITEERALQIMHFPHSRSSFPSFDFEHGDRIVIDEASVALIGDNANSSSDSRYWGTVPESNLRGQAVLRYFPLKSMGFLK